MSNVDRDTAEERERAAIISQHLDPAYTANLEGANDQSDEPATSNTSQRSNGEVHEQESSLKLQGGDIHRDLYKISARGSPMLRAQTFSHPQRPTLGEQRPSDQRLPGGFRRNYMLKQSQSYTVPYTRNFVQFLDLY